MTTKEFCDREFELIAISWEGGLRCIYLNDYRIAGGKPWGGGTTLRRWKIKGDDVLNAFPELRRLLTTDTATDSREEQP